MDELTQTLINFEDGKYAFLKLYSVTLNREQEECVFTFLYPETLSEITEEQRTEILNLVSKTIPLNSKIRIKFKKSFLDEKLLRSEISSFLNKYSKAIFSELSPEQIIVNKKDGKIKVELLMSKLIKDYYERKFMKIKILDYLENNFIGDFELDAIIDDNFDISDKITPVSYKIEAKKSPRYEVTIIKKLFGKDIAPFPEQIKNNLKPKTAVILFGKISHIAIKSFVAKKGKMTGQEKKYANFTLDDGKVIECVYFSTKSNETKLIALEEGLSFLCLGDIKIGLSGRPTYYIKSMTLAQIKTPPQELDETVIYKKPVVKVEDFYENKQENLFTKSAKYNEIVASNDIVVYDLETTGLDPENCEIIEIGAIKIEKGVITKKFSTFVKPIEEIPESATKINHITNEMVANAPKIEDAIVDFYNFSKNCIISGYNNTDFDNKFLRKAYQKVGLQLLNENIDVLLLARSKHLKTPNSKLGTVATALGIDLTGAHRAYNDAFATAKVLLKLSEL